MWWLGAVLLCKPPATNSTRLAFSHYIRVAGVGELVEVNGQVSFVNIQKTPPECRPCFELDSQT